MDEYERKLKKMSKSMQQEENTEQGPGEFELPTGQLQNVLGEISRVAREYHIILPHLFHRLTVCLDCPLLENLMT